MHPRLPKVSCIPPAAIPRLSRAGEPEPSAAGLMSQLAGSCWLWLPATNTKDNHPNKVTFKDDSLLIHWQIIGCLDTSISAWSMKHSRPFLEYRDCWWRFHVVYELDTNACIGTPKIPRLPYILHNKYHLWPRDADTPCMNISIYKLYKHRPLETHAYSEMMHIPNIRKRVPVSACVCWVNAGICMEWKVC